MCWAHTPKWVIVLAVGRPHEQWQCNPGLFGQRPYIRTDAALMIQFFSTFSIFTLNQPETPDLTEETSRPAPIGNQDSIFSIAVPQTHVGRSRRTRNLKDLFICECGSPVRKAEIDAKVNVIQCNKTDCETRWVSSKFYQFSLSNSD